MRDSRRRRPFLALELPLSLAIGLAWWLLVPGSPAAQTANRAPDPAEAARRIMTAARYCALVTMGEDGRPRARTMDPFPPDDGFVVWMATNPRTRKVREIRRDRRVTLYYYDAEARGYVTLFGTARLVDDPEEKARRWKPGWEAFYPDRDRSYLLIEVTPERLEISSPADGIDNDPVTWLPRSIDLRRSRR
jgi:general stress protein 26